MEAIESRLKTLESRVARWRLLSVALAVVAGVGAWAAARAFPAKPPLTEVRLHDGSHAAILTAKGLELRTSIGTTVLSFDALKFGEWHGYGAKLAPIGGLQLKEEGKHWVNLAAKRGLQMGQGDTELVSLKTSSQNSAWLHLGRPNTKGAASVLVRAYAADSMLQLTQPRGHARLYMGRRARVCAKRTEQKEDTCANIPDLARLTKRP